MIISLIIVHILGNTIEILVHLDLIHGKQLDLRVCIEFLSYENDYDIKLIGI